MESIHGPADAAQHNFPVLARFSRGGPIRAANLAWFIVPGASVCLSLPPWSGAPFISVRTSRLPAPASVPNEPNHALVIHEFLVTASIPVRLFARALGIIAMGTIAP